MRRIVTVAVGIAIAVAGAAGVAGPAGAAARHGAVSGVACGIDQRLEQVASGGIHVLSRPNAFNTSGQKLCIEGGSSPGFKITTNLKYTGAWQAYPFTGWGCAYELCSQGASPVRVSKLPRNANSSWSWRPNGARGTWNASYDDWFSKTDQISAEDDGAELMIWLRTMPGYCLRPGEVNCGERLVKIGHREYWFGTGRDCDKRSDTCWNYLQFRTTRTVYGVKQLWLGPFIKFLEARKLVRPWWWLTSIHAGYEMVSGGKGLQTTWFNAHV